MTLKRRWRRSRWKYIEVRRVHGGESVPPGTWAYPTRSRSPEVPGIRVRANTAMTAIVVVIESGALRQNAYPRERVSLWLLFFPLPPTPVIILAFGYVVVSAILGLAGFFANIAWEAHILGLLAGYALARRVAALDLPMPAQRRPAALDLRPLEPLAVREDLRQILERIRAETVPDVRDAWIEEFAAKAPCPQCGRALLFKGRTLLSQCGWRTRL